jgi:hypothetical protein
VAGLAEAHLHPAELAEGGLQPLWSRDAAGQVRGLDAPAVATPPDREEDSAAEGADPDLVAVGPEHEAGAEEGRRRHRLAVLGEELTRRQRRQEELDRRRRCALVDAGLRGAGEGRDQGRPDDRQGEEDAEDG